MKKKTILNLDSKPDRSQLDESLLLALQAGRDKMLKHYIKTNWIYCVVLILDSRHKFETFKKTVWGNELFESSKQKFETIFKEKYYIPKAHCQESDMNEAKQIDCIDTEEQLSNDAIDFNMLFKKHSELQLDLKDNWKYEIESYCNKKRIGYKDDILEWWKKK